MAEHHVVDLVASGADRTLSRLGGVPGIRRESTDLIEQLVLDDLLPADVCAELIERIDREVRPSTVSDPNGDESFRTSSTCDLDHHDPLVRALDARLHDLVGIPAAYGEPLQGQRYEVGQEFKAHTDTFDPNGADWETYTATAGQRTWTVMVYLNLPGAGGETHFVRTGAVHRAQVGRAVIWNNIGADGTANADTLHHGMKVLEGSKYIVTKWFRERPWPWPDDMR